MGRKSCTLTVTLPMDLYSTISEVYLGDKGHFNSVSEFGNYAMHWYYEKILLFIFEKNKEIDENIRNGAVYSGTTKLGVMYRALYLTDEWNYDPAEGEKTESIRITGKFATQIDTLIKRTGFFRSKADFCLNAMGVYTNAIDLLEVLSIAISDKSKEIMVSSDFEDYIRYLKNPCQSTHKKKSFGGVCKSDKLDWLD